MEFRTLKMDELWRWAQFCSDVFQGTTDTPEYFHNHFTLDPWRDIDGIFIAEQDGEIVSSVRVFQRDIHMSGDHVRMGGIGEVCTRSDHRKQGLSSQLLQMALAYMRERGIPLSLLFTGVNSHYARMGWITVPRRFVALPLLDALPQDYQLRALEERDLPVVLDLSERGARALDGTVARNTAYWRDWMPFAWKNPQVLTHNGELVAYLDSKWDAKKRELSLRDWAGLSDSTLLWAAMSQCARQYARKAHVLLPSQLMPGLNNAFVERTDMMWRVNTPFSVRGHSITCPEQLIQALANATFFPVDSF